jgi:hypothetical protein
MTNTATTMEMRRMGFPVEKFSSAPCDRASLVVGVFTYRGVYVCVSVCLIPLVVGWLARVDRSTELIGSIHSRKANPAVEDNNRVELSQSPTDPPTSPTNQPTHEPEPTPTHPRT